MNNYDLENHKRKDTVKWIITFVSIILLVAAVLAIATKGFTDANPYGWFDKEEETEQTDKTEKDSIAVVATSSNTPVLLKENSGIGGVGIYNSELMKLAVAPMSAGIETEDPAKRELTGVTLTATIYPENALQEVVWSLSFADPTDPWTEGKEPSDYIDLQLVNGGATQVVVSPKQPFASQILVHATATVGNPAISAIASFDYAARLENTLESALTNDNFFAGAPSSSTTNLFKALSYDESELLSLASEKITMVYVFGEGSVSAGDVAADFFITLLPPFKSALANEGLALNNGVSISTGTAMELSVAEFLNLIVGGEMIAPDGSSVNMEMVKAFNRALEAVGGEQNAFYWEGVLTTEYESHFYCYNFSFDASSIITPTELELNIYNYVF